MKLQNGFIGLGIIACMTTGAGMVAANHCFQNADVNTCTRLLPPAPGKCHLASSMDMCVQGSLAASGLDQMGQVSSAQCTYYDGTLYQGVCVGDGQPAKTSNVQCQPAVGAACSGGGGNG